MTLEAKGLIASAGLFIGGITLQHIVPALVGAVLSGLMAWFWFIRNAKARLVEKQEVLQAETGKRIASLETQLALVGQQVLPLSAAWQKYLIEQLTHLHTPELDALMVKLGPPNTLTEEEEARMLTMLDERKTDMDDRIDDAERIAAEMLPVVLQFIHVEKKTDRLKVPEVIAVEKPKSEESKAEKPPEPEKPS